MCTKHNNSQIKGQFEVHYRQEKRQVSFQKIRRLSKRGEWMFIELYDCLFIGTRRGCQKLRRRDRYMRKKITFHFVSVIIVIESDQPLSSFSQIFFVCIFRRRCICSKFRSNTTYRFAFLTLLKILTFQTSSSHKIHSVRTHKTHSLFALTYIIKAKTHLSTYFLSSTFICFRYNLLKQFGTRPRNKTCRHHDNSLKTHAFTFI